MPKFFIDKSQIEDNIVAIKGSDAKHIASVLRYKTGDDILVCDNDSYDYFCIITEISKDIVKAEIKNSYKNETEPNIKITLYQGLPKGDKMETVIQKCIEAGVDKIVPVITENTIVKLDGKEHKKVLRWNKIAEAAAKQCARGKIPYIEEPMIFNEAINASAENDSNIIPYEKEQSNTIRLFSKDFKGKKIGVFIGPEGGFSSNEIKIANQNGIIPITLGKRIFRTETAGLVTIVLLIYELS